MKPIRHNRFHHAQDNAFDLAPLIGWSLVFADAIWRCLKLKCKLCLFSPLLVLNNNLSKTYNYYSCNLNDDNWQIGVLMSIFDFQFLRWSVHIWSNLQVTACCFVLKKMSALVDFFQKGKVRSYQRCIFVMFYAHSYLYSTQWSLQINCAVLGAGSKLTYETGDCDQTLEYRWLCIGWGLGSWAFVLNGAQYE